MRVGIVGGSGYVGGELLRILLFHPSVKLTQVVSREHAGEYLSRIHPNLRGITNLTFSPLEVSKLAEECDLVFSSAPHGASVKLVPQLLESGLRIIDMGADFRLKDPETYKKYYGWEHPTPHLLKESVYGLAELHRDQIKGAHLVSCPGCMALTTVLGVLPLIKNNLVQPDRIVVDAKIGSSGAGAKPSLSTHHPERSGSVRPYKTVGHRHLAEIEQELSAFTNEVVKVAFTPHAVNIVRGILCTIHAFLKKPVQLSDLWRLYRSEYKQEPFIRLVRDRKGLYQLPDPKALVGSNFCDIGFDVDEHAGRVVVFSSTDNMVKGAAGAAVQCLNIMMGQDEKTGLMTPALHPM